MLGMLLTTKNYKRFTSYGEKERRTTGGIWPVEITIDGRIQFCNTYGRFRNKKKQNKTKK